MRVIGHTLGTPGSGRIQLMQASKIKAEAGAQVDAARAQIESADAQIRTAEAGISSARLTQGGHIAGGAYCPQTQTR